MSEQLPDRPTELAAHRKYLDTLNAQDLNTAAAFIFRNPDCDTDVVKMAVDLHNA